MMENTFDKDSTKTISSFDMCIKEIFESRKDNPQWNTSYPLSPEHWAPYLVDQALPFDNERNLSFYIHIPFCRQLCSFCEYTRMVCPSSSIQRIYLDTLDSDIKTFKAGHQKLTLQGFDVGGGTPTALDESCFQRLMEIYQSSISDLSISENYEPSIEGTFDTLSDSKLSAIVENGILRLSLGIQSTNSQILGCHHRKNIELESMQKWIETAWKIGIKKINLDLMYGLKGQSFQSIESDLKTISILHPQQVTLYELRNNMIAEKFFSDKIVLYEQYTQLYEGLRDLGYCARFGENTFSLNDWDKGLSSYLRNRMFDGVSYKGFGISAQSMSKSGLSYNKGKGTKDITKLIGLSSFENGDTYLLPKEELASKYIAIGAYCGSISFWILSNILQEDAIKMYGDAIYFCTKEGLATLDNGVLRITKKGFEYYGAVFSLFYSNPKV